jgi:outer membrane lipase/esterase
MTFPFPAVGLVRGLLAASLAVSLLASCGGSSSQVDAFTPLRVLSFGDELSLLTPEGKKYTTNSATATAGLLCAEQPLWVQYLATARYGMVFSQCNPDSKPEANAKMLATYGATVDGFVTQTQAFAAGDSFSGNDMVTVMVGMNDVLAAYARYPVESAASLTAEMTAKGELLGATVNRLTDTGARVLISTVPDIGLSPYAIAEKAAHTDTNRAALLTSLVNSLNLAMRKSIVNDGSKIGLLLADDLTKAMVRVPSAYGLANTTVPVCATALPDCTSLTLITSGNALTYLWADSIHPASTFQSQLGVQAVSRVNNNPF